MDSDALAKAQSTGIQGGQGNDYIESSGVVTSEATADTDAVGVTVNVSFAGTGAALGAALSSAETTSEAVATGLDGGGGDDTIIGKGDVVVAALANTTAVSVGVSISGAGTGAGLGAALMESDALAKATATGIQGGEGTDTLQSEGDILARATADTDSVGVTVGLTFAGTGAALGAALADSETRAEARSRGIDGVEGDIVTEGSVTSRALANTTAVNVTANISGAGTGAALGAALMDTDASAVSDAVGIAGGDGGSLINTKGLTMALSTAEVDGTGVTVGIGATGTGVGGGAALAHSGIQTDARARGIDAGGGDDVILSEGAVIAGAWSDITSTQVTANIAGTGTGASLGAALMDTSSTGSASSTGITGGSGMDVILSEAAVTSSASSLLTATDVTVDLGFAGAGAALGAALSKSTHTAISNAVGLDGGADDDDITSAESVSATAVSDIDATAVTVSVKGTAKGFAGSAALTDTSTNAFSSATGIAGGGGGDSVVTEKQVTSSARTEVDAASVSVSLAVAPVAGGAALTDASTLLAARSTGIDGGEGSDDITSKGTIEAHAHSDVDVTGVAVNLSLGVGGGAALAEAGSVAGADARGVEGGRGDDAIESRSAVIANTTTIADATSVGVNIGLLGYADSDAEVLALAQSRGLSGGEGKDIITNAGGIAALSDAKGYAGGVTVNLLGGATGEATTTSSSFSSGMDGGPGDDELSNEAALVSTAVSYGKASTTVVQLIGYSNADASTNAFANAVGMEGGDGIDDLVNLAAVGVLSNATGKAVSVNVNLLGATFAEAETLINAKAAGLDGGEGDDMLRNEGPMIVNATTSGDAKAVSVTVAGYGDAGAKTNVLASSTGMQGGAGSDELRNAGDITVYSTGQGEAKAVNVTPLGALSVDADTLVQAFGLGMEGGEGNDTLRNEGSLLVEVETRTDSESVGVTIAGSADAKASANAVTDAAGMTGGGGADEIVTTGDVTVLSTSTAYSDVTNVTLLGAAFADAGTNAVTNAVGIDGGGEADVIRNEGGVFAMTTSTLTADSSSINILGFADSASTVTSRSSTTGITGGEGDDYIMNFGTATTHSFSTLTQDGSSFTFGGASSETGVLDAFTSSKGIAGGGGADIVNSTGAVTVVTSSSLSSDGDSTAIFGASDTGGATGAVTFAAGIDGEGGDDILFSGSAITVDSTSTLFVSKGGFTFGGTADATGTLTAGTYVFGIDGGAGGDWIRSTGAISATATSLLSSSVESTVIFGSSYARSTISADSMVTGIAGGAGDDTIESLSTIDVTSHVAEAMVGSSFAFGGTSETGGTLTASNRSTGISGGTGEDWILSDDAITVNTSSLLTSVNKSDAVFGTATSGVTIGSFTEGAGIEGGDQDDTILNLADLTSSGFSNTVSFASSWTFGGGAEAKARFSDDTRALGITGGDGTDRILNDGNLTTESTAVLTSTGGGKTVFGSARAGTQVRADAFAIGADGGDGDDVIENTDAVNVRAVADMTSNVTSVSFVGGAATSELLTAFSNAVGLAGGGGSDEIWNLGDVTVDATATAKSLGGASADLGGGAKASGTISVDLNAVGIDDRNTSSLVINTEDIAVTATAEPQATHSASAGVFFGDGYAAADVVARLTESGVSVGDGNNEIRNEGSIALEMSSGTRDGDGDGISDGVFSRVDADGGDFAFFLDFGDADGRVTATASANQTGILAGDGNNRITNTGEVSVTTSETTGFKVSAVSDPNGGSLSIDGDGYGIADATGTFRSAGISAGTGVNEVMNDGLIRLDIAPEVISVVDADGPSGGGSGDADAFVHATGDASVFGITVGEVDAGLSENRVVNTGEVDVIAAPSVTAWADANGQVLDGDGRCGYSDNPIRAVGTAVAGGIVTAAGTSRAENYGFVNATAVASAYARGNSDSDTGGSAWTFEWAVASAQAEGIHTGPGQSEIINQGHIVATAHADGDTWGWADRAIGTVDGDATSNTWAYADAFGILAEDGDVIIENAGTVDVNAVADADAFAHGDDDSYSNASANGRAYGISVGVGLMNTPVQVDNTGIINTTSRSIALTEDDEPSMAAWATDAAYGISIAGGDAVVTSSGDIFVGSSALAYFQSSNDHVASTTSSASATGIELGDIPGSASVPMKVIAITGGSIHAEAEADNEPPGTTPFVRTSFGQNAATANSLGINAGTGETIMMVHDEAEIESLAGAHTVSVGGVASAAAGGIWAGSGNISISNEGTIRASAVGTADVPSGVIILGGFTSSAAASGVTTAGTQGDTLLNGGDIIVSASASSWTLSLDCAPFPCPTMTATAGATGMDGGEGNNWVENNGTISVSSVATAGIGSPFPSGGTATASATGIRTGAGDDVIINLGTITATVTQNGVVSPGVGIDSGGGNDTVTLNSFVDGHIDLGSGEDTLTVVGDSTVTGTSSGSTGADTLILDNTTVTNTYESFESLSTLGTVTLSSLSAIDGVKTVGVNEGVLILGGDYTPGEDMTLQAQVNGDGTCGTVEVAGSAELAGAFATKRGRGAYVDGTTFTVLSADSLRGAFREDTMSGTALLGFEPIYNEKSVQLEVDARSFTAVASNEIETAIARYLDVITPGVEGELSDAIGDIQWMNAPQEFTEAFGRMSPGSYGAATLTTYDAAQAYADTLRSRMHQVRLARAVSEGTSYAGKRRKDEPLLLAYAGSDASLWQLTDSRDHAKSSFGMWLNGFGAWGEQDNEDGFTGYDFDVAGVTLGFDYSFSDNLMAGVSIAYSATDVDFNRDAGDADIDSVYGSLYGSYFTDRAYLETVLSYGFQDYENSRATLTGTAGSDHDGDVFSVFGEGGYNFDFDPWVLQPFASLHYLYIDEDGFQETGSGAPLLVVGARETEALISGLGARVTRVFRLESGSLIPEASAAWHYDFDIDDRMITTSFAGAPDSTFSVRGQDVEQHGLGAGAGVSFVNKNGFSTSVRYKAEFRDGYESHGVLGEVRYEF
jgi:uncharacterized protein YhjY with autotransporter beta-barrel domain